MSPPVSDAAASDDSESSPDILGTTKVPGQSKRRRLKISKEAVPASLSTGIHPPAQKKSRTLKPSSTHTDAGVWPPSPLRMMSSVASNVESIAGPP
eukprot:scaffold99971_cov51-Attheya_sp.AAC.1